MKLGASSRQRASSVLGIAVAAEPRGDFRQHADGGDVGRLALQVLAQQRLGHGDASLAECERRLEQPWVARGRADVLGVGRVGTGSVAHGRQVVTQCQPRVAHVRLQLHGLAERLHGSLAIA